jgi:hypothetical protein
VVTGVAARGSKTRCDRWPAASIPCGVPCGGGPGGRLSLLRKHLPSYARVARCGRLMPIARRLGGQSSRHFAGGAARIADIASQLRRNAEQLQHALAHTSSALAFRLRMANDCRAGSTQRTALHPATRGATAAIQKAGSQAPWEPVFFLPRARPGMLARAALDRADETQPPGRVLPGTAVRRSCRRRASTGCRDRLAWRGLGICDRLGHVFL